MKKLKKVNLYAADYHYIGAYILHRENQIDINHSILITEC